MAFVGNLVSRVPEPLRSVLIKHREMLKFAIVGATCFLITVAVNYGLKLTILNSKPVSAQTFAVVIATIVSYVLSREWSFRTRGGRERHHEAALFFLISGISTALNSVPLAMSRYWFNLQVPHVSLLAQETADFFSGMIIGTLIAMVFRWWAFKKWVFPQAGARIRLTRADRRLRSVTDDTGTDKRAA
jgi:putative flippase GtrA